MNTYWLIENGHVILINLIAPLVFEDRGEGCCELDFAVLTQEHFDHIYSENELKNEYDFPILCGANAIVSLRMKN